MKLNVHIRAGEKASSLRKDAKIPAIVYGKHLTTPVSIYCNKNEFIKQFKAAGYSTPITIHGTGIEELVLVQDFQLDPVTDIVLHVDFLAVSKTEKVTTEVPVVLFGESLIEKTGEGKIQLIKDFVEVEAFPQDLPHDIKIDISEIKTINDTVFVRDLKFSNKVTVVDDLDQPIITVASLDDGADEVAEVAPVAAPTTPAAA
ncbi:MAG: 50S ribosomal protein L25 [Candidatus Absconditabacteria bacterium]